jgi:amino acid permease
MQGVFNLTKASIGAGMLFLPWNMHRMGLFAGIGSIIFAGFLCSTTLHYLARIGANTGADNYFKLGRLAYGSVGEMAAVAALLFNLLGGLINYANFAGDYLSSSLVFLFFKSRSGSDGIPWYISPSFLKIAVAGLGIFPLACLKDMSKLSRTSLAGLLCMGYILLLTVWDSVFDKTEYLPPVLAPRVSTQFFSAFGNIIFAFVNHFTIVAIVPVMIDPSPQRRSVMITSSNLTVLIVYLTAAIFGYLHFGSSIDPSRPDILNSPLEMSVSYAIAKLAFASVMVFSYPLICDPARSALDQLITRLILFRAPERHATWSRLGHFRHYFETVLLVALPTFIAVTAANYAALFLDIFSSLCGSLLVFIFPSLYFMKLSRPKLYNFKIHIWERVLIFVNIFVGVTVAIIGTFDSIWTIFTLLRN